MNGWLLLTAHDIAIAIDGGVITCRWKYMLELLSLRIAQLEKGVLETVIFSDKRWSLNETCRTLHR